MTSRGIDLLISFEGLRLNAYLDSSGKPTIGYGCTFYENGDPVKMGDTISPEEAMRLFKSLVDNQFEKGVRDNLRVELRDNQIDALTSLCYNIGVNALKNSTVLRLINAEASREDIEKAWKSWRMSGGQVLQGLVNRRERELEYYYSHEPNSSTTKEVRAQQTEYAAAPAVGSVITEPTPCDHKLDFLYSPSFWSMFFASIALMFGEDGVVTTAEIYKGLMALSTGFTVIYTANKNLKRFAEAIKTKNTNL